VARLRSTQRWLTVLTVGIVALYILLFAAFARSVGPQDADQFLVFHELQYWNFSLFGLAKQWSPVMCSGLSLAAEPQVPFLSLGMLLAYLAGPFWGLKLATVLYFVAGWIGAYLYAGLWLQERVQRSLVASLFIGNGFFIFRLAFGHDDFIPFLTLPLMLWALHTSVRIGWRGWRNRLGYIQLVLLFGGGLSLVIDGSPVSIIHLLFWVALYAFTLAMTTRSFSPLAALLGAAATAAVLDAGYLWPMLEAQAEFPRLAADTFTNPLALPWFAVMPVRGRLIQPANGMGHEMSVCIGPVVAWLIWRYRRPLWKELPVTLRGPIVVVGVASLVLGMGSLAVLHIPSWLSPFDLLRPLPGFRSLDVTARYWGFFALPLSLLGAAALFRFVRDNPSSRKGHAWMAAAVVIQLVFQGAVISHQWIQRRSYSAIAARQDWQNGGGLVDYGYKVDTDSQSRSITPSRGVIDCYDDDDFQKANMLPGKTLVLQASRSGPAGSEPLRVEASFLDWSHLQLSPDRDALNRQAGGIVRIVLNQAYNRHWTSSTCDSFASQSGNLTLQCPVAAIAAKPIVAGFLDPVSTLGARVSVRAWLGWIVLVLMLRFVNARTIDR